MIGFVSSAYSAQVSPTVAVSSRFGVNIYSYESDLSVGGEWWIGRRRGKRDLHSVSRSEATVDVMRQDGRFKGVTLRAAEEDVRIEKELDSPVALVQPQESESIVPSLPTPHGHPAPMEDDRDGVLKARISGNCVSRSSFPL